MLPLRRSKLADIGVAMALVRSGDTVVCSGFVSQGAPESLLSHLGSRTNVRNLTLLFEGGPGDYATRGLNHLAKQPGMLQRAIGAHYGQVPQIASLALADAIAAYALPMGAISRMIRSASSHSPGFTTRIGMGTFVDPRHGGGKLNSRAQKDGDLVSLLSIDGVEYLHYRSLPVRVALVKGSTGDPAGNITFERESLLSDARIMCAAAKASGGVVIAQVARVAELNSLMPRQVHIPGVMVDAVVLAPDDDAMGYFAPYNASWTGELKLMQPQQQQQQQPRANAAAAAPAARLDARKIIGRRAALELKRGDVVNLGIGMPEMVAEVCREEAIDKCVTLTTEAGVIGGVGAAGHNFGAGSNYDALLEINQIFDFYNGGGLSVCFLGMAQVCAASGNVNVSRLSADSLTGPGGFIDISQSTRRIVFMGTFTKKGLDVAATRAGGLAINKEGAIRAFCSGVREVSFSGRMAIENGQDVLYVTERAVLRLTRAGLELIEVADGVDARSDVLDCIDGPCAVSPELKRMDARVFAEGPMGCVCAMAIRADARARQDCTTIWSTQPVCWRSDAGSTLPPAPCT